MECLALPETKTPVTQCESQSADRALQRVAVLGAGALGCYYGGRMAQSGREVALLLRKPEWQRAVLATGLRVQSVAGDFVVHPRVASKSSEFNQPELILLGLKSTSPKELQHLLEPVVLQFAPMGTWPVILTLQNGLGNEEAIVTALEGILGTAQAAQVPVAGGIAFICSQRGEPGEILHTAHGWVKMGWHQAPSATLGAALIRTFEESSIPCEWTPNLLAARYEKLVWNIPFNGLGVAAGATVADVLASPDLSAMAVHLMDEVLRIAQADGCALETSVASDMMERSRTMGPYRTSMQIDYEAGRPLEVQPILGEPLARAHRLGVSVPYLELLHALVSARDSLQQRRWEGESHAR